MTQHGKSQCVTETLPSWYLGKYPTKRVIEVSYGDDLARRFGRRNKQKSGPIWQRVVWHRNSQKQSKRHRV